MSDKLELIYTPDEKYVTELMHKKHALKLKHADMFYDDDRASRNEVWKEYMVVNKKLDDFFGSKKR